MRSFLLAALLVIVLSFDAWTQDRSIILQSTTSTANSGLYRSILPKFERETKIRVHVVAVGTGQAIRNARNGDGDVLLVHAKEDEQNFVDAGYGTERLDVMYNDFVIAGPPDDPAAIASMTSAPRALAKIAKNERFSPRAVTIPAPTRKRWNFGSKPVLIRHPIAGNGIAKRDRAWEQH